MNNIGIRETANDLIKSYLLNRTQSVKIEKVNSTKKRVKVGVPQESKLGPLLFLIYINNLPNDSTIAFIDDKVILSKGDSWKEVENGMNNKSNNIHKLLCSNQLSLNIDKTVCVIF